MHARQFREDEPDAPTPCMLHEYAVLAIVMLNNELYDEALPLAPGHFVLPTHGKIWSAIVALHDGGYPLTPHAVLARMRPDVPDVDWAFHCQYVQNLLDTVPVAVGADYHAEQVRLYARNRKAILQAQAVTQFGENDLRALTEAERMQVVLTTEDVGSSSREQGELVATTIQTIEDRIGGKRVSFKTGLSSLTSLNVFTPQCFVVLAARPSVGKSLLAYQIAQYAAAHGSKGLFVSLEMSGEQLTERALVTESGVSPHVISHAHLLDADQWSAITTAAGEMASRPLWVLDIRGITLDTVALAARRLKAVHGLDFVVIDYVQLLPPPSQARSSEAEALTIVSRKLKALARELDICLIGLSQVNRDGAGRRPDLTNLAGSDSLGRDADTCLVLWPNSDRGENGIDANTGMQWLILDCQKNRNGPRRAMELLFNPGSLHIGEVEAGR